jgi:hypothetical protein
MGLNSNNWVLMVLGALLSAYVLSVGATRRVVAPPVQVSLQGEFSHIGPKTPVKGAMAGPVF